MIDSTFYKNKRVFISGHTGFKGSWLSMILLNLGADVCGYALEPKGEYRLFEMLELEKQMNSIIGDIRNLDHLQQTMRTFRPDIVIHMAAQPLVRESYKLPVYTYDVNVMGTVNILEAVRNCDTIKSVINVTTDKVYRNIETYQPYVEDCVLDGYDPYSNSKSCSELITNSYRKSYLHGNGVAVSTCRAGNVIGGGDFAEDRIIPDCVRAAQRREKIILRNPLSVRPYQHVLEPLFAYLLLANRQYEDGKCEGAYNIGPDKKNNVTTGQLTDLFCKYWGNGLEWECKQDIEAVHEANLLYLDCTKAKDILKWKPFWGIEKTVEKTVEWYLKYMNGGDMVNCTNQQIIEYIKEAEI